MTARNVKRIALLACVAALAVVVSTSPVLATGFSKSDAKKAVEREVKKRFDIRFSHVHCQRLTGTLFTCDFWGLTHEDVQDGNVDGHGGTARAKKFPFGIEVQITSYGQG